MQTPFEIRNWKPSKLLESLLYTMKMYLQLNRNHHTYLQSPFNEILCAIDPPTITSGNQHSSFSTISVFILRIPLTKSEFNWISCPSGSSGEVEVGDLEIFNAGLIVLGVRHFDFVEVI